ncbi:MAG: PAS domain-containing protein, partial [Bacteroidia bacterium]|nr:PAS domain-containing protein [Bacteroidia bacterium]
EATYLWGYSREELIGQPHSIIRSKAHPPKFFERMWDRIKSGFVWQGEVENTAKDGTPFWVYLTITPVLDAEGKPYKYIGVAFDITRQKVQAQRLKEALRQLETQTENLPHRLDALPWFLTDRNGIIQAASPALLRMLGYSPELFIGQPTRILRSPQTPDYLFMNLWATIGRGKPWQGFLTNRNARGVDSLYFLAIFPQEAHFLAVLLPAEEACEILKAEWLKNHAPIETLKDYEALLQAKDHEIYELRHIIQTLQSSLS